jgi:hypothetical protein
MATSTSKGNANDYAVGGLVVFLMLWFLWPLLDVLKTIALPGVTLPPRLWLGGLIAVTLLIAGSVYLRAPAVLWQVPLQALVLACLMVGVNILIFRWRSNTPNTVAICFGYVAVGAFLGWLMRDLQRHFLSPHKRANPPNPRLERP